MSKLATLAACSLALMLSACITRPALPPPGTSYFWLPMLHISDEAPSPAAERMRDHVTRIMAQRGFEVASGAPLALVLSMQPREDDGSLGLGQYAGGYTYFTPPEAEAGYIVLNAYDTRTARLIWRVSFPREMLEDDDADLAAAIARALDSLPVLPRSVVDPV